MITLLPWLLSLGTLLVMWWAGDGRQRAWVLGLALQPLWIAFAIAVDAYGLIPLSLALMVVYARNLRNYRRVRKGLDTMAAAYSGGDWLNDARFGWERNDKPDLDLLVAKAMARKIRGDYVQRSQAECELHGDGVYCTYCRPDLWPSPGEGNGGS